VGGHEGLDIINPQKLRSHRPVAERPLLSGLRVMDRRVNTQTDRLSLTASDNQFTIFLSTNSGEVHNRTRFAYRLLGLSDQWRYTDDATPDITYMGLAPGRYTFCARLLATDGTMGTDEVRLAVSVSAPWYRSWWMNIFYLALTVLLFYWFYRRAKDKLRLERLKLEQENKHRLGELRQKFAESINADLRLPFQNVFESLNEIMERETDEQRYEKQQQVFSHVEQLLEEVSKLGAVGQERNRLNPEVRELEIVSLDEKLVKGATNYVEGNLDNADITVETMAEALGMSRVHLYKRLTAITGMSPSEFIRQIRLRHAEQLLSRSQLTVAEVAYRVGFNNPRYLSKYFKEQYGVMPSEYKGKLNSTKQ
jgi:AraC-like DNA-binding protein